MKRITLFMAIVFCFLTLDTSAQFTPTGFITTWKTDNTGSSADNEITIPTSGGGYNYDVYWEEEGNATNNGTVTSLTGTATITFPLAGTYRVQISGTFPRISFFSGYPNNDRQKIQTIEQWGTNAWTTMYRAFYGTNVSIPATDAPNLSGCTDMSGMFYYSSVNSPMNHWDVSTIENMAQLFFSNSGFNQDLGDWDVGNVTNMTEMFRGCLNFNQDISDWDVSSVEGMTGMFHGAFAFNQDIDGWTMDNVQYAAYMFYNTEDFNQDLNSWNVSNVQNMSSMFQNARGFNGDISSWTPTSVTSMSLMFADSPFNGDIGGWNVSSVENMSGMFYGDTVFNQYIGGWTVNNVQNMSGMFEDALNFDQDISGWTMTGVTDVAGINSMFRGARDFNKDLSAWVTTNITNMAYMFDGAVSFDQNLGGWDITNVTDMTEMLSGSGMSVNNYDNTLIGWEAQAVQTGVTLGASGLTYCSSVVERQALMSDHTWMINDDTECAPFITTWQTDNSGTSGDDQITIPTTGAGYDYDIYWEEVGNPGTNGTLNGQTGDATITFPAAGAYQVEIKGDFPRIFFNDGAGDSQKILTVEQWGYIDWTSMAFAFFGCTNLTIPAIDAPDLSNVTDMTSMFGYATSFNQNISNWDVSNVTDMSGLFYNATSFNQDISGWTVTNVTDMASMFNGASAFNQDISGWNVGGVTSMNNMFSGAIAFNQDIDGWSVSNVTDMGSMFNGTTSFDQDISSWDISSVTDMSNMLDNSGLSLTNYDNILTGWEGQAVQPGVTLGATGLTYCAATDERQALINDHGWMINGDMEDCGLALDETAFGSNVTISPNPTSGNVIIELENPSGLEGNGVEVIILTVTGESLYMQHYTSHEVIAVPAGTLPSGMYVVKLISGGKQLVKKLIRQ